MRVKSFFNDIEYPEDFKSREKIFKQYHEKINHISGNEMKKKDFISLIAFIVLTLGSILKARKDLPKRFINDFLYKENKYHAQPSWALNITRVLIVLVCLFKPYMLVMGLGYILLSPYTYYITYAYYIYSQYDNVQQLQKKKGEIT